MGILRPSSEVFEYHSEPWNRWLSIGNIQVGRYEHTALSIGPQQLPCSSSDCPPLPPSPSHLCAAPAGAQDCHYTIISEITPMDAFLLPITITADHCCCGPCSQNFIFSCVTDSTTGAGLWQMSTLCPVEGCGSEGITTSPDYPGSYPKDIRRTEMIKVEEGLIISLQFTAFDILTYDHQCLHDHLTITDNDGTVLMEKSCGNNIDVMFGGHVIVGGQSIGPSLPAAMRSSSNIVKLLFSTSSVNLLPDGFTSDSGWSISWSAVTPECSLAFLGSPCSNLEADDCKNEHVGEHCCCGQCSDSSWLSLACVPDSTTGARLWQPTLCPGVGCGSEGEVASPNYPDDYPKNIHRTEIIEVEQGSILSLKFTAFDIHTWWQTAAGDIPPACTNDHLTIRDGDGTTLMEKSCGPNSEGYIVVGGQNISSNLPPNITSRTNIVKLVFITMNTNSHTTESPGWSVSWSAVTPGSEN